MYIPASNPSMKILIIGAAGKTGRQVVAQALLANHHVVAFVHNPKEDEKQPFPDSVEVIHGDVQNPSRLEHAMQGCHAVIDTIGGKTPFKSTDLEASAAKVILEVMHRTGTRRLLAISVLGAADTKEQAGFFYEHLLIPLFLAGSIKDKNNMEAEIMHSDIDWTIVRPPILSDHDAIGRVHIVQAHNQAHKITRADLAQFLVDNLTSPTLIHQAVTIANT